MAKRVSTTVPPDLLAEVERKGARAILCADRNTHRERARLWRAVRWEIDQNRATARQWAHAQRAFERAFCAAWRANHEA